MSESFENDNNAMDQRHETQLLDDVMDNTDMDFGNDEQLKGVEEGKDIDKRLLSPPPKDKNDSFGNKRLSMLKKNSSFKKNSQRDMKGEEGAEDNINELKSSFKNSKLDKKSLMKKSGGALQKVKAKVDHGSSKEDIKEEKDSNENLLNNMTGMEKKAKDDETVETEAVEEKKEPRKFENINDMEPLYRPKDKKKKETEKPKQSENLLDEQPVGGGGGYNLDNLDQIEDTYVPSNKGKNLLKKKAPTNPIDEQPIGGGGGYNLDNLDQIEDTYVPSKKAKKLNKPKPVTNPVDEMPIGGGGGYDLDNLDKIEDTYVPSKKAKPKPKPKPVTNPVDEMPIGGGGGYNLDNLDQIEDTYVPSKKARAKPKPKPVTNPVDEQPIGGGGGYNLDNLDQIEDTYVPSKKAKPKPKPKPVTNPVEEQAIGGGGGGYNLDNLDQIEDTYVPSKNAKPKPKPKPMPTTEQPTPNNPVSDIKIGGGTGGYNLDSMANAFPTGQGPNDCPDISEDTLEMRLKSSKFQEKVAAYEELKKWEDEEMTQDKFLKNLHLTIKERHVKVLPKIIEVIENLIDNNAGDWNLLDFTKFLLHFCEHAMSNAKGEAKKKLGPFIIKLWDFYPNKDKFMDNIKACLGNMKMKVQVNILTLVLELLKGEKIEEMQYMKPFMSGLEKLCSSRTAAVKKGVTAVFREAYLWMGDSIKVFLTGLKPLQLADLEKLFEGIDKAEMKTLTQKAGGKKVKKLDAYEIADEKDLPKPYNDDAWADGVMDMKKWKDKKFELDNLLKELDGIAKLNPKTNTHHFISLARRLLSENNIMVQVVMLKILGKLSNVLRKNFLNAQKNLFGVLVKKLKEKNKTLTEAISECIAAFYISMPFEDSLEDFKENLKEKNTDKKHNILKIILNAIEKQEKIKNEQTGARTVKMVIKLIEESDPNVRDLASQVIAKLKDLFPDKISPLLSDLNSQKLKNINKYSTTQAIVNETEEEQKEDEEKNDKAKGKAKRGKNMKGITKDKRQMICDIRENLFSNKTVKISDTKNFSKYLESNLKQLAELTKDFKEVSTNQQKEIFILIEEIGEKVEKAAFLEDSRKAIAHFFIELTIAKYNDEIIPRIRNYIGSPNKLLTFKNFINDSFDVISRRNIKVSRDLLILIVKLLETELSKANSISAIPHKSFVEFLKNNFSTGTIHSSVKQIIISLMRTLAKKFGSRVIGDYPSSILKDYETYNNEIQKQFKKTMEKLNDKNMERRKNALTELANLTDNSKIQLFWSMPDFVSFLKRSLITESQIMIYELLVSIVKNYLEMSQKSAVDFSLKTYLSVFHIIITQYYDRVDNTQSYNPEKFTIIEDIFSRTINEVGPTKILNEMLNEVNAFTYKEQICNFFMQFGEEIETSTQFMEYIVSLIKSKHYNNEIKQLVDNVLLILKNTANEDIIFKGNENKIVRDVWQKNEEDVLFDENFVKGNKIFEDISLFNSVRVFIQNTLGLDEQAFFSKHIDSIVITEFDDQIKIKLAFFYLKSIENIPTVAETIFCQLKRVNLANTDNTTLLLVIKNLINLMKNNLFACHDGFYQAVKELFVSIVHEIHVTVDELFRILDLNGLEIAFITKVLNNVEGGGQVVVPEMMEDQEVDTQYQTAKKPNPYGQQFNNTMRDNSMMNDTFMDQRDYTSVVGKIGTVSRRPSKPVPQMEDEYYSQLNKDVSINIQSPRSYASKNSSRKNLYVNQLGNQNDRTSQHNLTNEVAPENKMMLEQMFKNMLTYDLVQFKNASDYFLELCKSKRKESASFLISNADYIIKVFTEVFIAIFTEGINFDLERSDYELIFVPLQTICELSGFLEVINQSILNMFIEQILVRLVVSNEEKTGLEAEEAEREKTDLAAFIVKSFNSIMLRIIDNSEVNGLLTSLFVLIINTKDTQNEPMTKAVYNLAFKCIVRITRNLKNIIQKVDPRIVLNLIFNYIDNFGVKDSSSIGSKSIKTLLNELVTRSNPEFIWNCYHDVFGNLQEQNISKWIKIIQSKMNHESQNDKISDAEKKLLEFIEDINKQNKPHQLPSFAKRIKTILDEHPSINFANYEGYFNNRAFYNVICKGITEDEEGDDDDQSVSRQSMSRNNINPRQMDDYLNNSHTYESTDYYEKINRMKRKYN